MTTCKDELSTDSINKKIFFIEKQIEGIRERVYENINSNYEEFNFYFNKTSSLRTEIDEFSQELEETLKFFEELKTKIINSKENSQKLREAFQKQEDLVLVISQLCEIQEQLTLVEDLSECSQLFHCSIYLYKLKFKLENFTNKEWDKQIIDSLKEELISKKSDLQSKFGELWESSFLLNREGLVLVRGNSESSFFPTKLAEVLVAMSLLDSLQTRLFAFLKKCTLFLLEPLLDHSVLCFLYINDEASTEFHISITKSNAQPEDELHYFAAVLENLKKFITFFCRRCFSPIKHLKKPELEEVFQKHFSAVNNQLLSILWKLLEDFLKRALHNLSSFPKRLESSNKLKEEFEKFALDMQIYNIPKLFCDRIASAIDKQKVNEAEGQKQDWLCKARNIILTEPTILAEAAELNESDFVTKYKERLPLDLLYELNEVLLLQEMNENGLKFPSCKISLSTQKLIKLIYKILVEACDSPQLKAIQLFYTARDILELYKAITPSGRSKNEKNFDRMIFHNDCMFIGHHLLFLGHHFRSISLPLPEACTFIDAVGTFRELAQHSYTKELEKQNAKNFKNLAACHGFRNISEIQNFQLVENNFCEILERMQQLNLAWNVLPAAFKVRSISVLINFSLEKIINDILELLDISIEEASELISLLTLWKSVIPKLFASEKDLELVENFDRLCQLIEILDSSMKDIMQRWSNEEFAFTKEELRTLIKALFQDSDIRQENLSKLK